MSKIGKKPIAIPQGVQINVAGLTITVKGPKGEIHRDLPSGVSVVITDNEARVVSVENPPGRESRIHWGLARALLANMIKGVSEGFEKVLEFQGVGYRAAVKGNDLELGLGFSHPVVYSAPEGISFKTEKSTITVTGIDKELVGKVAGEIRSFRKPEPYKGKGIRYQNEVIRRKAGKKAATAA